MVFGCCLVACVWTGFNLGCVFFDDEFACTSQGFVAVCCGSWCLSCGVFIA